MPAVAWEDFRVERIEVAQEQQAAVRVGGSGPPLVLLHGFPQHALMWRRVAPLLSERFTVIAPDSRGMGASSLPATLLTKSDHARDLAIVLDALGHDAVHVAGYDLGAGTAVAFARDFPQRTTKLAVMEFVLAGFGLEQAMAPQAGWNADSNWHFAVLSAPDVAVWLFAGRERALLDWFFGHESHQGLAAVSATDRDAYADALGRPGALRAGVGMYAAIFQDAADNAPLEKHPLTLPVLAVGGAAHAGPMLEQMWAPVASDLTTAVIPRAGHWLADENPADTAAVLAGFFDD